MIGFIVIVGDCGLGLGGLSVSRLLKGGGRGVVVLPGGRVGRDGYGVSEILPM